jgi:hypothetical protein
MLKVRKPHNVSTERELSKIVDIITACYLEASGAIGGLEAVERNRWGKILYANGIPTSEELDDDLVGAGYYASVIENWPARVVVWRAEELGEEVEYWIRIEADLHAKDPYTCFVVEFRGAEMTECSLHHEYGWPDTDCDLEDLTRHQKDALDWYASLYQ